MKSKLGVFLSVVSAMFVVSGCADNYSGNTYQSNRAGIVQNVSYGTVTNIRQVNIQDDSSNMPIGAVAGAVVGGLLGHTVGGGTGKKLATVGGVVAGGLAGNAIQNQTGKTTGMEVEIRLDNGQTIVVDGGWSSTKYLSPAALNADWVPAAGPSRWKPPFLPGAGRCWPWNASKAAPP